jgi:hypothetical protein
MIKVVVDGGAWATQTIPLISSVQGSSSFSILHNPAKGLLVVQPK